MSEPLASRGRRWISHLTGGRDVPSDGPASVLSAEAELGGETAHFIAVVPNPQACFPRARDGEVGLEEGWALARVVRGIVAADTGNPRRPILAVVDVTSQAYGRCEEMLGIHLACAAAAGAYAEARLAGHPIVALLVGKAMSGAFLAHGYQANRLVALDAPGVLVHAMGKQAAARITRRPVSELDEMGDRFPPMAYDIANYARLGLLHELITDIDADRPDARAIEKVRGALIAAVGDIRASGDSDLRCRLSSPQAQAIRGASVEVRRRLAAQWDG